MGKFMKPGKVVLVQVGCYSRHKAIIVKITSDGPYSQALVAGVDRYPHKVTAATDKRKIAKRSNIKSFVKVYNYNHLMPTKYSVDILLDKTVVNKYVFRDPALKRKARQEAKVKFEKRYKMGKNKCFFQKLQLPSSGRGTPGHHPHPHPPGPLGLAALIQPRPLQRAPGARLADNRKAARGCSPAPAFRGPGPALPPLPPPLSAPRPSPRLRWALSRVLREEERMRPAAVVHSSAW
ncbi:PREDICTED: 60S ribosomal protein L27-like [Chrysochloris asiatica]|uniref:Large ribosomal subunit protein eL27 n=1 Tax=Chrysochloris asiatica TaxID=185453 RepID=A0A9B0TLX9_CHRAS|nr:PREDICTED: 60S ribosomal protein L27-like [Chrysochloris asiatica]